MPTKDGDLLWGKPTAVFLDEPFRSTGLAALYADEGRGQYPLPGLYLAVEGIDDFLVAVGVAATVAVSFPSQVREEPEVRAELGVRQERELQHRAEGLGHRQVRRHRRDR